MIARRRLAHVVYACAAALMLLSCDAPTATRPGFAYDPTTLSNRVLYRWTNGSTIRVWIDPAEPSTLDIARATRAAIGAWNPQSRFAEYTLVVVSNAADANIIVFDRSRPVPIVPSLCPFDPRGAVGYTYFCATGGRAERLRLSGSTVAAPAAASVVIRVDRTLVGTQSQLDAIVTHEFGHALGIGGHSGSASDVMFGLPVVTGPSTRDAATLQYVLGSRPDVVL